MMRLVGSAKECRCGRVVPEQAKKEDSTVQDCPGSGYPPDSQVKAVKEPTVLYQSLKLARSN